MLRLSRQNQGTSLAVVAALPNGNKEVDVLRYLRRITSVGAAVAVLSLATPAAASSLAPGGVVAPVPGTSGFASGWSFLDQLINAPWGSPTYGGLYNMVVYQRPGGGLDFLYQVGVSNGSSPVQTLLMSIFTGFDTDVFYYTEEGTAAPASADRSAVGDVVSFTFNPAYDAGTEDYGVSKILVIRTNATAYTRGSLTMQTDGARLSVAVDSVAVDAFAPTATPIPEPATLTLTGLGLAGAVARRRRSRRMAS